jgi:DNA-binding transcriptional LysR family regulator
MELRHLRYFVAVAEELHFRRAAERLHISQPPLSQQIRGLEQELGVTLLERSRRRVELTPAGESFLREARAILDSVERASESARRVARGELGALAIGFVGSAMFGPRLPSILRDFRAQFPGVELHLRELPTTAQLQALIDGRLDVGVIRGPIGLGGFEGVLEFLHIQREHMVAALPSSHRLAAAAALRPEDLRGEAFVILDRRESPALFHSLATVMADVGGIGENVLEVVEMQTVIALVASGFGVSLVPESVGEIDRSGVTFRAISGVKATIDLTVAWRAKERSPIREAFLRVAQHDRDPAGALNAQGPGT